MTSTKWTFALGVLLSLLAASPTALAANGHPRLLPPDVKTLGKTNGEWSAAWWQWVFAQRIPVNPVIDPTGEDCDRAQTHRVWFLAGTFGGNAARTCTVPYGRPLFVPLANIVADNFGFAEPYAEDPEGDSQTTFTRRELVALCESFLPNPSALAASIDGRAITNLARYAVEPVHFSYTVPNGNNSVYDYFAEAFGDPRLARFEGRVPPPGAISCGYYLMVAPLPQGTHTIRFAVEGFLDVTYHLTVAPRG